MRSDPVFHHHAFVSYRHADLEVATALTHALQVDFGLRAWLDLDPGEHDRAPRMPGDVRGRRIDDDDELLHSTLAKAIDASILVLVLTSPRVLGSVWVRKEIVIAERQRKPLFFWHLAEEGKGKTVSVRRSGAPLATAAPDEFAEIVAKDYRKRRLATTESAEFMSELSDSATLNILGHRVLSAANVRQLCVELNALIELCELIVSKGESVSAQSMQQFWAEYERLDARCDELMKAIAGRFGRTIQVGRVPMYTGFHLRQPFIQRKLGHLERILEDEDYRRAAFQRIGI